MDRELDRPLALTARRRGPHGVALAKKLAVALAVVVVLAAVLSRVNFHRDLRGLDARVLSGPPEGNYHAVVAELAALAQAKGGRVTNLESAGSVENVARLGAVASGGCPATFAL